MKEGECREILRKAIANKELAGFQNMTDNIKACKFAEKRGYKLADRQELRTLLTEYQGMPMMIFILALNPKGDIAVFLPGKIHTSKYGSLRFLKTRASKVIKL